MAQYRNTGTGVTEPCSVCGGTHYGTGSRCPILGDVMCAQCWGVIAEGAQRSFGMSGTDFYGCVFCPSCASKHTHMEVYECITEAA